MDSDEMHIHPINETLQVINQQRKIRQGASLVQHDSREFQDLKSFFYGIKHQQAQFRSAAGLI